MAKLVKCPWSLVGTLPGCLTADATPATCSMNTAATSQTVLLHFHTREMHQGIEPSSCKVSPRSSSRCSTDYDCSTFLALEGIPCVPRSWKLSVKGSCIQVEVLQTRHVTKPAGCNWVVKGIAGKIKLLKVCKVEARERLVCAG